MQLNFTDNHGELNDPALVQNENSGSDFTLVADSCWITVGDASVYIRKAHTGDVETKIYLHQNEMGTELKGASVSAEELKETRHKLAIEQLVWKIKNNYTQINAIGTWEI